MQAAVDKRQLRDQCQARNWMKTYYAAGAGKEKMEDNNLRWSVLCRFMRKKDVGDGENANFASLTMEGYREAERYISNRHITCVQIKRMKRKTRSRNKEGQEKGGKNIKKENKYIVTRKVKRRKNTIVFCAKMDSQRSMQ